MTQKPTLMILGSYHMANPGKDAVNFQADDDAIVSSNPYKGDYWFRLGEIHYHLNNYDPSTEAFKMSIKLGDNPQHATYNIGRNFALQNNSTEAVKWLGQALMDGKYETSDGPKFRKRLETDSDLDNIRHDGRFIELLPPKLDDNISRVEGWRTDLKFMAERMEQTHYNLFHTMRGEEWKVAIENLHHKIPQLEDHQIIVEFMKIVALVGDGHTEFVLPLPGFGQDRFQFHILPVMFYEFSDGLFIRSAAPAYKDAVGTKVLKIGNMPTEQTLETLRQVNARGNNEMAVKSARHVLLAFPEILHALKISDHMDQITVSIENEAGSQSTIMFKPEAISKEILMALARRADAPGWVTMRDSAVSSTPLWLKNPSDSYWFEYLEESELVYVQFNQVRNKSDEKFSDFCKRIFNFINSNEVEALVIDIRVNSGGNSRLNQALLHEIIKCEKINRKGKLFTIVGRRTFSAAMNLAVDLERHTQTLFVGEPTGSSPNFVGEFNEITLPYSGLMVSSSCIYWQSSLPWDKRIWIAPDIVAELASKDYQSNVDPAMNAILHYLGNGN